MILARQPFSEKIFLVFPYLFCNYEHMPSYPRNSILPAGEQCLVHTISRCVRKARLCGRDPQSGTDYEHRRDWVKERIQALTEVFAVEVCAYAVMSNHSHLVLWCRPDLAASWPAEEVARRWTRIFNRTETVDDALIARLVKDEARIAKMREHLGSVSWFMRCLNEHIARQANKEDDCTGRFWEGRFKSQLLADDGAVLACMAYVDLNPVRAKMAVSLEESEFTSVLDRLTGRKARRGLAELGEIAEPTPEQREMLGLAREQATIDAWLCPLGTEAGRHTPLDISEDGYLALVEWTGLQLAVGKPGVLSGEMQGIMTRMGLDVEAWVETVRGFGRMFSHVAGSKDKLREQARRRGQCRARGTTAAMGMYAG